MSRANAEFALPPGDRDDAPVASASPPEEPAGAGREPGDLTRAIREIGAVLDEAAQALADIRLAQKRADLPAMKAAAWRLCEATMRQPHALAHKLRRAIDNAQRSPS